MSQRDTGQRTNRFQNSIVTASLITAIILCISLGLVFLSASGLNLPPIARADTETVNVSYTPSYDTQYSISVPSNLTLAASGAATTLTISVSSWSDFPTDRSLYCELTDVSTLTNASNNSVDMIVKNVDDTVTVGDTVGTFSPSSIASDTSASFAVLTVEPSEKPSVGGTYTGTIELEVGMVD